MIRVLSYPPRHDYVDRLHGQAAELVHRDVEWPRLPQFYDPSWIAAHADDWDVAHLHFTWEQYPPEQLEAVLDTHERHGTPVVWTVHDLDNPHIDGGDQDRWLEVLSERADAVATLTPSVAARVRERFGRDPVVIPHGPVIDDRRIAALRRRKRLRTRPEGTLRVLFHGKAGRANLDWRTPVAVFGDLAADGERVVLHLHVHEDSDLERDARGVVRSGVVIHRHGWLPLPVLCEYILAADVLLLPYRWGTHSGMLELAADVGTPVVATDVGAWADQGPLAVVPLGSERTVDAAALREVVLELLNGREVPVPSIDDRERARTEFLDRHRRLYRDLAARD